MEENRRFGKKPMRFIPRMMVPVNKTPKLGQMKSEVLSYIMSLSDVRKAICGGCPSQRLYDKNGKLYNITRQHTLDEVKNIVEEIRKVNSDGGN